MGCFCFVSFGRTVSSMLLHKKKLVTEVTWGWRKFKVIGEEIVNEQKWLHFAMQFLSTQKGYDFMMSAMEHRLFACRGGLLHGIHGNILIHIIPHPPPYSSEKVEMLWHDFCLPQTSFHHLDWLVDWLINLQEWWIPVAWCLSCLTHSIAVTRWLQRPQKRRQKRVVESDDPMGVGRELKGVLRWMKGRLFSTFFWLRSGFG